MLNFMLELSGKTITDDSQQYNESKFSKMSKLSRESYGI
jgi:hypothetical protein